MSEVIGQLIEGDWTGIAGSRDRQLAVGRSASQALDNILRITLLNDQRKLVKHPSGQTEDGMRIYTIDAEPPYDNPIHALRVARTVTKLWQETRISICHPSEVPFLDEFIPRKGFVEE